MQYRRETIVSKCKVWKLTDEHKRVEFQTKMMAREADRVDLDVESMWQDFKKCLSEVAEEVCGKTKGPQKDKETWWWNDEVKGVVEENRNSYLVLKNLKDEISQKAYNRENCDTMKVISRVKEEQRLRFVEDLEKEDKQGNLFRAVKQMASVEKERYCRR